MELQSYFETLMRRGEGDTFTRSELEAFANLMSRDGGSHQASKLIANTFASTKTAVLGFEFLEALLSSPALDQDHAFRVEIGRYRFLNEIIRLLSPKYNGLATPERIKSRAVQFIQNGIDPSRKWFNSVELNKIMSVHKSLVETGIIQMQPDDPPLSVETQPKPIQVQPTTPTPTTSSSHSSPSIFDNAPTSKLLKSLLQSKSPADIAAANRLIQNLVQEDAARNSRISDLNKLIKKITAVTELVDQMLTVEPLDTEMIGELLETCKTLRIQLSNYETMDDTEVDSLLRASATIENTMEAYNKKLESHSNTLLIGFDVDSSSNEDPVSESLQFKPGKDSGERHVGIGGNSLNLLQFEGEFVNHTAADKPIPLETSEEPKKKEPFEDLEELSIQLMKQNLLGRSPVAQSQQSKKSTLLELKLQNSQENFKQLSSPISSTFQPKIPVLPTPRSRLDSDELLLLDNNFETNLKTSAFSTIKDVRLEDIEIRKHPAPLILLNSERNNGIQVVVTFGSLTQRESESILVTVITLTNQNQQLPLCNYTFALLPPSGIQVKLFPASLNELGPWKTTFLPPPVLTQVGLIQLKPTTPDIKMSYILSYSSGIQTFVHNSEFVIAL